MSRLKPFISPILITITAFTTMFASLGAQEPERPPRYVGVDFCAQCHASEGTGQQVQQWREGPHGQAWIRLGTDAAAEVAKRVGVRDPQTAPECLRCHTTAAGIPGGSLAKGFERTEGVQCESCHGPGEKYAKIEHMIMHDKAKEFGLIDPSPRVCKRCHNENSPTFKGFDYRSAVKQIEHGLTGY